MSRRLVCGVCPEASQGLDVLRAQGGGGFPRETLQGPGMAGDHATRRGKKGQLEEENSRLQLTKWMAVVSRWASTGFPLGQDRVLDEDLCPSSPPPFCLGQSGDKFFSLLFFSFVLVAFVCYS